MGKGGGGCILFGNGGWGKEGGGCAAACLGMRGGVGEVVGVAGCLGMEVGGGCSLLLWLLGYCHTATLEN